MRDTFYKLGTGTLVVVILIKASFILKPITLGLLIAMILYPAVSGLQKKVKYHSVSYISIFMLALLFLGVIFSVISFQLFGLFEDLNSGKFSFDGLRLSLITFFNDLGISSAQVDSQFSKLVNRTLTIGSDLASSIISNSSSMIFTASVGIILSYFFSAYYSGLREAFLQLFAKSHRPKLNLIFDEVPKVVRRYLKGMSIVMIILAILNTIIYLVIGLEYALIWGLLSGIMAFIPYVGSAIALVLPLSYSFITSDGITQPILVLIGFILIQQLEGNILTPKIVGDAVDINPLAAILFMIVSAQIWGIYGVFISIMVAGILKIVLEQWKAYQSLATLLSEEVEV